MDNHGGHLVFLAVPAWGHLRPLTTFASKIAQLQADSPLTQRTIVTLFTAGDFTERTRKELASSSLKEDPEDSNAQIRVISLGGEGSDPEALMPIIFSKFSKYYELLLTEQKVTCHTGSVYGPVPKPTVAVVDYIAHPVLEAILAHQPAIPILAWSATSASSLLRLLGPGDLGGMGDVQSRIVEEIGQSPKTDEEINAIKLEAWRPSKGNMDCIPGLEPFYDYEMTPQDPGPYHIFADIASRVGIFFSLSAGVLLATSPIYEPVSLPALRTWLASKGKYVHAVGPLVPTGVWCPADSETVGSPQRSNVFRFMDDALQRHGEKSVLYISFGSVFWPSAPEYVWVWLELLLELGIPFIFSAASPLCNLPESLVSRISTSGLGLVSPWAPQESILPHAATGWFLSHCGQNSVTEALGTGVPIIAWPIEGDQPISAAYLALKLDTAFELVQVRTGHRGLRPLYRGTREGADPAFVQPQGTLEAVRTEARDILSRIKGEEGRRKRRNVEKVKDDFDEAWGEGGEAWKGVEEFLEKFARR